MRTRKKSKVPASTQPVSGRSYSYPLQQTTILMNMLNSISMMSPVAFQILSAAHNGDQPFWKGQFYIEFYYRSPSVYPCNWLLEYMLAFHDEYTNLDLQTIECFQAIKSRDAALLAARLTSSDLLYFQDKRGISLLNWIQMIKDQAIFNIVYQVIKAEGVPARKLFAWAILCQQDFDTIRELFITHKVYTREIYHELVNREPHSPIHIAAGMGRVDVVNLLLELDPDIVTFRDWNNYTALDVAVNMQQHHVVNALLAAKLHRQNTSPSALPVTFVAPSPQPVEKQANDQDSITLDVASVTFVAPSPQHVEKQENDQECITLDVAIENNDIEAIKLLYTDKLPLLHAAVDHTWLNVLSHFALTQDKKEQSALIYAIEQGNHVCIDHLLQLNVDVQRYHGKNKLQAIHIAAIIGDLTTIQKLLSIKQDLYRVVTKNNETPLMLATEKKQLPTVVELLKAEAKEAKVLEISSYMHMAIEKGYTDTVTLLLDNDANLITNRDSERDSEQESLLMTAQRVNNTTLQIYLLSKHIEHFSQTDLEKCYFSAIKRGQIAIIKLLSERQPVLLDYKDNTGRNWLALAVNRQQLEIAVYLRSLNKFTEPEKVTREAKVTRETREAKEAKEEAPKEAESSKPNEAAAAALLTSATTPIISLPATQKNKKSTSVTTASLTNRTVSVAQHGASLFNQAIPENQPGSDKVGKKASLDLFQLMNRRKFITYMQDHPELVNTKNQDNKTLLCVALQRRNLMVATLLVQLGADVNVFAEDNKTLLSIAMAWLNEASVLEKVKLTILFKNIIKKTHNLRLPTAEEAEKAKSGATQNHANCVRMIEDEIQKRTDDANFIYLTQAKQMELLFEAVDTDNLDDVKRYLALSPTLLNCVGEEGITPLSHAIESIAINVFTWLLEQEGIQYDEGVDGDATTPLSRACSGAGDDETSLNMISMLLKKGANARNFNDKGNMPLHKAYKKEEDQVMELLLAHDITLSYEKNSKGKTLIDLAHERDDETFITHLYKLRLLAFNHAIKTNNYPRLKAQLMHDPDLNTVHATAEQRQKITALAVQNADRELLRFLTTNLSKAYDQTHSRKP